MLLSEPESESEFELDDPDGRTVIIVVTFDFSSAVDFESVSSGEEEEDVCEGEDLVLDEVLGSGGGMSDPPVYMICSDSCVFIPSYEDMTDVASLGAPHPHCEKPDQYVFKKQRLVPRLRTVGHC